MVCGLKRLAKNKRLAALYCHETSCTDERKTQARGHMRRETERAFKPIAQHRFHERITVSSTKDLQGTTYRKVHDTPKQVSESKLVAK